MRSQDDDLYSGIRQKRSLSQVFLQESWPCQKIAQQICDLGIQRVLEIGPGNGILTKELLKKGLHVTAVEKDKRFADRLINIFSDNAHIQIHHDDILKFDLSAWLEASKEKTAICGNIPYSISSPILQWLLPYMNRIIGAFLLVQLEFAQRLASQPNHKSYGSLSVFTQLRALVKLEFKVSKSCFYPIPKVDSAVVSLLPHLNKHSDDILQNVEKLTRQAFTQRRKKLSNSLSPFLKDDTDKKDLPVDLNRRCDSLSPEEFIMVAKALFS